jgi:hypothetical protein
MRVALDYDHSWINIHGMVGVLAGIHDKSEKKEPSLKENTIKVDFRYNFFVENCLIVELKAIIEMHPMFEAKLLNHMKRQNAPKGILINFNCGDIYHEGQTTYINDFFKQPQPSKHTSVFYTKFDERYTGEMSYVRNETPNPALQKSGFSCHQVVLFCTANNS